MKTFEYQAKCGNTFYAQIEVQELYNNKRVYKGIMLYGNPGRSRWGKSYKNATWRIERFSNTMLEMSSSVDFTPGVKSVKDWYDPENLVTL